MQIEISEDERATLIASLTLAAIHYHDPAGQIALLEKLGCVDAAGLLKWADQEWRTRIEGLLDAR